MATPRKQKWESQVILGEKYRDTVTGLEGVATVVSFYLHACERVSLEFIKEGEVKYETFDAPRLVHVKQPLVPVTSPRTGGPGGNEPKPRRTAAPRR